MVAQSIASACGFLQQQLDCVLMASCIPCTPYRGELPRARNLVALCFICCIFLTLAVPSVGCPYAIHRLCNVNCTFSLHNVVGGLFLSSALVSPWFCYSEAVPFRVGHATSVTAVYIAHGCESSLCFSSIELLRFASLLPAFASLLFIELSRAACFRVFSYRAAYFIVLFAVVFYLRVFRNLQQLFGAY